MQAQVVGYEVVDYQKKNSPDRVHGLSVHVLKDARKDEEFYGRRTQEIWVSDLLLRNTVGQIVLGNVYEFVYDYDGKFTRLVDIVPIAAEGGE